MLERGEPGRRYAIGGEAERRNIDVVHALCGILDRLAPRSDGHPHDSGIVHVADRPGHDQRYAIDPARIRRELGWSPQHSFETGLEATVQWYLDHRDWWHALNAAYQADTRRGLLSGS